ncbi:ABC transporter permease [Paucibacter sp. DJ2R-2]|uniref:ABC transporter permease n=1 Tax=Paucibacter sp. DJ2R-2 TaxID=2893558 RepID=UPI0021E3F512|nr:ABC transporter permease [Paucibacter sp. DJ2R-2]MCV2419318.1 ABC transporter permease [Paucibacter sp. DJ4R-1]MCV2437778.1 ABC transporter permease [Paucibacter sp. DJ2R-2]
MKPLQILNEALRALNSNRLRSALTMLGVVIGIASVLLMLSVGDAVRSYIAKELAVLGSNQLIVQPGTPVEGGVRRRAGDTPNLTLDDARALAQLPSLRGAAPALQGFFQLHYGDANSNQTVLGTIPAMLELRNWQIERGVAIDERDVQSANRVAVIGSMLARKYYADRDPVGQVLRLDGQPFTIIGVLAGKGRTLDGTELGELTLVPISAMPLRLARPGLVHYISLQAHSAKHMDDARQDAEELLRDRHHITGDKKDDFVITDLASIAETGTSIATGLSVGLGVIGAISLLVGGIGIMNIMLVSVSERVREIGIRMAIGARPRDVLWQFLGEALVLCLIGGVIGLGLAALGALGVNSLDKMSVSLSTQHMAVAVGFASLVGLFFGYYPARRASTLLPIECLRQD